MAADLVAPDAADPHGSAVCILDYSNDPRSIALLTLRSFWSGAQHDTAPANWDGSPNEGNSGYLLARYDYSAGQHSTNPNADAWSYSARRPNASAPMPRCIVSAFTAALLGRPPQLATPSDPRTAKYLTACWDDCDGWATLTEARNYAGVQAAAALVVAIIDGRLALDAYWAHEMHVLDWCDAAGWKPRRAIYQTTVYVEQDPDEDGQVQSRAMVRTREWDEEFVTIYEDVDPEEHEGPIPVATVTKHGMGRCPVVWMQNTRNSREPEGVYDLQTPQVLELCDQLDRVQSFAVRATKANASPTLYRKDHMHWLQRGDPIRKGHGAEITGTPDGDVKFLESDGAGVTNSWNTARELKMQILQATNCILPDMSWAVSNIAVETFLMLFRAMDSQCNLLQVPLQRCIREICDIFLTIGADRGVLNAEEAGPDATGLLLPPDVTIEEADDDDLDAEPVVKTAPYEVGKARWVQVVWPPRQLLSPVQLKEYASALGLAEGAGHMSKESAIEALASARGVDAAAEKRRIRGEKAAGRAELMANGLTPGAQVGDQALADEATSDGDGDGKAGDGGEAEPKGEPEEKPEPGDET